MPFSETYKEFISNYPALQSIGDTPLIKLNLPIGNSNSYLYAKQEQLNPGGSIKDRPISRLIVEAILAGELTKDKIILDATSGNAGIAYAMVGSILGYKVKLVMPSNASEERKKRILAHGADIVLTDAMLGYDESLREVKRIYESDPKSYYYADQYSNHSNPMAHYETTGFEIIKQLPEITHFVAGVGTGGTITGIGRRLKEHNPNIRIIGISFDEWPGIEGLKPLGPNHITPQILDESIIDETINVDIDDSLKMSKLMAKSGYFAGQSSGAYVLGAKIAASKSSNGHILTIFNDIGERYFSTAIWG